MDEFAIQVGASTDDTIAFAEALVGPDVVPSDIATADAVSRDVRLAAHLSIGAEELPTLKAAPASG